VENIEMVQDLVAKIRKSLQKEDLNSSATVEALKKMRTYTILDEQPKLTKTLRLVYEHLEENKGFFISIPSDEAIEIEEGEFVSNDQVNTGSKEDQIESFEYFLDLVSSYNKASSIQDIEAYKQALLAY
jgi:hypothetical protein